MTENADPESRVVYYTTGTLVGTLSSALVVGLLSSPVLFYAVDGGPILAGFAVLSLVGLGVYFSQKLVFGDYSDTDELGIEIDWRLRILITLLGFMYYNIVLLVSIGIATYVAVQVHPLLGLTLAIVYPPLDLALLEDKGIPLGIAGLFAIALAIGFIVAILGERLSVKRLREIDWKEIHLDNLVLRMFASGPDNFGAI